MNQSKSAKSGGDGGRKRTHTNSYRQSKCKECGETMMFKSLSKHFSIFHPNKKVAEDYGTMPLWGKAKPKSTNDSGFSSAPEAEARQTAPSSSSQPPAPSSSSQPPAPLSSSPPPAPLSSSPLPAILSSSPPPTSSSSSPLPAPSSSHFSNEIASDVNVRLQQAGLALPEEVDGHINHLLEHEQSNAYRDEQSTHATFPENEDAMFYNEEREANIVQSSLDKQEEENQALFSSFGMENENHMMDDQMGSSQMEQHVPLCASQPVPLSRKRPRVDGLEIGATGDEHDDNMKSFFCEVESTSQVDKSFFADVLNELKEMKLGMSHIEECRSMKFDHMEEQISTLVQSISSLTTTVEDVMKKNSAASALPAAKPTLQSDTLEDNRRLAAAKSARSVDGIITHLPNWGYHYASEKDRDDDLPDGLFCKSCSDLGDGVGLQAKATGVVHYNFDIGQDFTKSRNLPKEFTNLKAKVTSHMTTKAHLEEVSKERKLDQIRQTPEFKQKSLQRGRAIMLNAYKAITVNRSQASCEWEMVCDHTKGYDVGTKNHSRKFAEKATDSLYRCLRAEMRSQLELPLPGTGRPTSISLMLDKFTPSRNTLDLVGFNGYLGDSIKNIYLSGDIVTDHSAGGIANALDDTLTSVLGNENWKSRFLGTASDGGMLQLNYSDILNGLVNANEECHEWYTHSWDYGHLIELAHNDNYNKQDFKWVKASTKAISNIHHSVGYGKSYHQFVTTAEDNQCKPMAPIGYSTTRWVRYSERVFKSFINNYPALYDQLQWQRKDELDIINNVSFILEVSGLHDVYRELGSLSTALQIPDLYPWQAEQHVTHSKQKLTSMSNSLRNLETYDDFKSLENDSNPLPSFTTALKNLSPRDPTFRNKPVLLRQHHPGATKTREATFDPRFAELNLETQITRSREKLASYIDALSKSIENRMERGLSRVQNINANIKSLFSMEQICHREKGEVPIESLQYYSELAKSANQLDADIDLEELKLEYVSFSEMIHDSVIKEYLTASCLSEKRKIEKNYYSSAICKGKFDAMSYSNITHLLQGATLRLSNESVVESMGSVVDRHSESRGMLGNGKLAKECYLAWNGPRCNIYAIPLMDRSLEDLFHTSDPALWNFVHLDTNQSRMDIPRSSLVVNRLNQEKGRIVFRSA